MSIEQGKKNEWILTAHSYQIADTGDYDGYYEIHRGKISFQTKYDEDGAREELQEIVDTLNRASSLSRVEGERDELRKENKNLRAENTSTKLWWASSRKENGRLVTENDHLRTRMAAALHQLENGSGNLMEMPVLIQKVASILRSQSTTPLNKEEK